MAKVAKTMGDCRVNHPEVWQLGTELADVAFETRSAYLIQETRTEAGAEKYRRLAAEKLLESIADGTFEEQWGVAFPEEFLAERQKTIVHAIVDLLVKARLDLPPELRELGVLSPRLGGGEGGEAKRDQGSSRLGLLPIEVSWR